MEKRKISVSHTGQVLGKIIAGYSIEIIGNEHGARFFDSETYDVTKDAIQSVADHIACKGNAIELTNHAGKKVKLTLSIES